MSFQPAYIACLQGDLLPKHKEIFEKNAFFKDHQLPEPKILESLEKKFVTLQPPLEAVELDFLRNCFRMDPADRMTTEVLLKHKYLEAIQARHCASNVLLPPGMSVLPSPAGDTLPQTSPLQLQTTTTNSRQPVGFGAAVLPTTEKSRGGGGVPQPARRKAMKNVYLPPYQLVGWPRSETTSGLGVIGGSCMPNPSQGPVAGGSQAGFQSLGCGGNPAGWRSGLSKPGMTFAGQSMRLSTGIASLAADVHTDGTVRLQLVFFELLLAGSALGVAIFQFLVQTGLAQEVTAGILFLASRLPSQSSELTRTRCQTFQAPHACRCSLPPPQPPRDRAPAMATQLPASHNRQFCQQQSSWVLEPFFRNSCHTVSQ
ncbi:Cyclin-dependent kinase-like 1 [Sparganum proliferum]